MNPPVCSVWNKLVPKEEWTDARTHTTPMCSLTEAEMNQTPKSVTFTVRMTLGNRLTYLIAAFWPRRMKTFVVTGPPHPENWKAKQ